MVKRPVPFLDSRLRGNDGMDLESVDELRIGPQMNKSSRSISNSCFNLAVFRRCFQPCSSGDVACHRPTGVIVKMVDKALLPARYITTNLPLGRAIRTWFSWPGFDRENAESCENTRPDRTDLSAGWVNRCPSA